MTGEATPGGKGEIRVMLLDDHDSFRQPLAFMLEREPDLTVVAQAGSLAEAREALEGEPFAVDVAVVDLDLPDGSGTGFIPDLLAKSPGTLALVLSAFSDKARLARAIEAGAAGVLHKSSPIGGIVESVRRLHAGEQLVSRREVIEAVGLASREQHRDREARKKIASLTAREREILQALDGGLGDKEIADSLFLSVATVRSHMTRILTKLGAHSRLQALVLALHHGLVELVEPENT